MMFRTSGTNQLDKNLSSNRAEDVEVHGGTDSNQKKQSKEHRLIKTKKQVI